MPITEIKKPPLELQPKSIYDESIIVNRINTIRNVVSSHMKELFPIKKEWIEEYNERLDELKTLRIKIHYSDNPFLKTNKNKENE